MKRNEVMVGGKYGDGKGRTRKVLDAGRHVANPQFRHAYDTDNVVYEDGKGKKGIMTRTRFAAWAKLLLAFLLLCIPLAAFAAPKAKALPKLVVAEMKAVTTIEPKLLRIIEEQMANEVGKTGKFSVIGRDDINRMLDAMQSKQMMGCTELSCYVELGGAMGADLMIAGTMDRVGATYLVTVKLINIASAEVLARESESIKRATPEELVEVATALVERMFAPKRPHRTWMWATAGGSAVTGIGGAVVLGLGLAQVSDAQGKVDASKSSKVTYTEVRDAESAGKAMQIAGYACLGVGVGLAVTSVVLWNMDKGAVAVSPVAQNGVWGLTVGGRF